MRGIDSRLTKKIRQYDRDLYVYENEEGLKMVMRKANRLEASDYFQAEEDPSLLNPQVIFPLTETGSFGSKPVEWGIERILWKIKGMDIWRDSSWLTERKKRLERIEEDKKRQQKNEFRALAADIRTEFAKKVNDINTSTL
jgi:hypothetical protein